MDKVDVSIQCKDNCIHKTDVSTVEERLSMTGIHTALVTYDCSKNNAKRLCLCSNNWLRLLEPVSPCSNYSC